MFRQKIADEICLRLSQGETLRQICKSEDMPSHSTVCGWAIGEGGAPREFGEQYARARGLCLDVWADEIIDISNTPQVGEIVTDSGEKVEIRREDMLGHRRLQIEARKWLLSKLRPDKYCDRTALEHSAAAGGGDFRIVVEHVGRPIPDE